MGGFLLKNSGYITNKVLLLTGFSNCFLNHFTLPLLIFYVEPNRLSTVVKALVKYSLLAITHVSLNLTYMHNCPTSICGHVTVFVRQNILGSA